MPSSLKTKLSKLRFKGKITNEEYQEIINKLAGHDSKVREDERRKFAEWLVKNVYLDCDDCEYVSGCMDVTTTCADNLLNAYEKEQKGETE